MLQNGIDSVTKVSTRLCGCLEPTLRLRSKITGDERKLRDSFINDRTQRDVHVTGDNRREKPRDYLRKERFPPIFRERGYDRIYPRSPEIVAAAMIHSHHDDSRA